MTSAAGFRVVGPRSGVAVLLLVLAIGCVAFDSSLRVGDAHAAATPDSSLDSPSSTDSGALAPSSDPPWNPPAPVPGALGWEKALRMPFVVAFSPIELLAAGIAEGYAWADNAGWVENGASAGMRVQSFGLIAGPSPLGDRTGLGAMVGWRPPFFRPLSGTLSATTRGYDRGTVALQTRISDADYSYDWRPEEFYFGRGPTSPESGVSNYITQREDLRLALHTPAPKPERDAPVADAADRPDTHRAPRPSLEVWGGTRSTIVLDGREEQADHPPLLTRHTPAESGILDQRVDQLVYGARAGIDARNGRPHWWRGGRVGVGVERHQPAPEALALHTASGPEDSFTRWTYEGQVATSFWRDPRTLRLSARVVDRVGSPPPGQFLLTDLALLGGSEGLRGYEPGRFRDADLMLGELAYIAPVASFVELELHVESGTVTPHLEHARIATFRQSYGVALRGRTPTRMLGQVGLEWCEETTRIRFSIGGVE